MEDGSKIQEHTGKQSGKSSSVREREGEISRARVRKTYKLYIGGEFPRTESGRYYDVQSPKGDFLASVCLASRKDFRNAVVSARKAFPAWSSRTAFNRGQILYRVAEILEGRSDQFRAEIESIGVQSDLAEQEVHASIDRLVYYAGWADKYQQVFSAVNPVQSSHFNFSVLEPMGVIGILAPESPSLLSLVTLLSVVLIGGNTSVVMSTLSSALPAVTFAEVLNDSDVPSGVVNILTGEGNELAPHFYSHMDVNALADATKGEVISKDIAESGCENIKRVKRFQALDWFGSEASSPYLIQHFQEVKTTWHPVGTQG